VSEGTVSPRPDGRPSAPLVLFDLDDTIFDHALTSRTALDKLRRSETALRARSLVDIWREYSRLLEEAHPAVVAGRVTVDESRKERFDRLLAFCGAASSPEEGARLSQQYRAFYKELRRPVPGARGLLERVHRRATVGVVTNNQVAEQDEKLAFLGLTSLIDFMIISEAAGVAKPDPRIFEIALARGGTGPESAVMIGDSWKNDVLGARAAGIRAVWFNRFGASRPDPIDVAEVNTFRRPAVVERLLLEH
jgi:HAD superfamily hydrolase (TIGR01509 family)